MFMQNCDAKSLFRLRLRKKKMKKNLNVESA